MSIPKPTLVRLEIWTSKGWLIREAAVSLLHPERYPERLAASGKIGRVTVLDDRLQPTGKVWGPTEDPTNAPPLPDCSVCLGTLCDEGDLDGMCLM